MAGFEALIKEKEVELVTAVDNLIASAKKETVQKIIEQLNAMNKSGWTFEMIIDYLARYHGLKEA